jgi:hypothetical protein
MTRMLFSDGLAPDDEIQKFMLSHPGSTLIDESARIMCGHSVAIGDPLEAHSPGTLVSCFRYEVRVVFAIGGRKGLFFESREPRNPPRIKF